MVVRLACALLLLAIGLGSADGRGRRPSPPVQPPPENRLGLHLLLSEGRQPWPRRAWRDDVELAAESIGPGGYVLQLLSDANRDLASWQAFMTAARRNRLRPIVRLATRYDHKQRFWRTPLPD